MLRNGIKMRQGPYRLKKSYLGKKHEQNPVKRKKRRIDTGFWGWRKCGVGCFLKRNPHLSVKLGEICLDFHQKNQY